MVRVEGWKGIAEVLCVSVPTAQRMRLRHSNMPVVNLNARLVASTRDALLSWRRDRDATLTRRVASTVAEAVAGQAL